LEIVDPDPTRPTQDDGELRQNACPRTIGPVTICPNPPIVCADAEPTRKVVKAKERKATNLENERIFPLQIDRDYS
jgi:hypothetical protein